MNTQNRYPLSWPSGWKRNTSRRNPKFNRLSMEVAVNEVLRQLKLLGCGDWNVVFSTNVVLRNDGMPKGGQANPADPGVAVYFKVKNKDRVLACDAWFHVQDNMHAIARHIDAMRAQERYGVGNMEQAFAGYTALPGPGETATPAWWTVLGVTPHCCIDQARVAYVAAAKRVHPDNGGSTETMAILNNAWEQAKKAMGV